MTDLLKRSFVFLILFVFLLPQIAMAQGRTSDPLLFPFYDPNGCATTSATPVAEDAALNPGSKVYVVGDSIATAATSDLRAAIQTAGFGFAGITESSWINADPGRAISTDSAGGQPPGLEAVTGDAATIADADAIVISLGTNSGNEDLNVMIPQLVNAVKSAPKKATARIFWVNLFYTAGTSRDGRNGSIKSNEGPTTYTVIDTVPANIELQSDGVHPTAAGNVTFAQTIVSGLKTPATLSNPSNTSTSDPCTCGENSENGSSLAPINSAITWGAGVWASGSDIYVSGLTGPYTIEQWAIHVLKNIARKAGVPESTMVTQNKVIALVAWAKAEGGGVDGHNGSFNPLNTKSVYSDVGGVNEGNASNDTNSSGYASFDYGVEAITRGLFNVYQKRIGSALLNPSFSPDALIQAKAGDFYSTNGRDVINRLEDTLPGEKPFAMASVTGFRHGAPFNNGVGDRELYIQSTSGSLNSVLEDYAAYAGKILDGSPSGTPAPLIFSSSGGTIGGSYKGSGCTSSNEGEATQFVDNFPIYKQNDPRWGALPYGTGRNANGESRTIASSGCGPSAMAMIITALTGETVTPADTAAFGMQSGSITYSSAGGSNGGPLATLMAANWGLKAEFLGPNEQAINNTLRSGGLVVVSGRGGLPFSPGGHFVVIRAVTESGKWLVGDSSHGNVRPDTSTVEYDPQTMIQDFTAGGYSSYAITK